MQLPMETSEKLEQGCGPQQVAKSQAMMRIQRHAKKKKTTSGENKQIPVTVSRSTGTTMQKASMIRDHIHTQNIQQMTNCVHREGLLGVVVAAQKLGAEVEQ